MSFLGKCFQVGSMVGTVCSAPLIPSFSENQTVAKLTTAGGGTGLVSEKQENPGGKEKNESAFGVAVQRLQERSGASIAFQWGCFLHPDLGNSLELFFCFNQNDPQSPTLFHWNGKGVGDKRVGLVESIGQRATTWKFEEGEFPEPSRRSKMLLNAAYKLSTTKTPFRPSDHCTIKKLGPNYQLSCVNPDNSATTTKTWDISKIMVETPRIRLK